MKKVWSMFMLLAVCLVACTNIDDLEDDVDALKKRVTALETQVRDINSNTEALRELSFFDNQNKVVHIVISI